MSKHFMKLTTGSLQKLALAQLGAASMLCSSAVAVEREVPPAGVPKAEDQSSAPDPKAPTTPQATPPRSKLPPPLPPGRKPLLPGQCPACGLG